MWWMTGRRRNVWLYTKFYSAPASAFYFIKLHSPSPRKIYQRIGLIHLFGFGCFSLLPGGRVSIAMIEETAPAPNTSMDD